MERATGLSIVTSDEAQRLTKKLSVIYSASTGFFLVSLLACTKSFASFREVNKPITRNTRDANDFVHAKRI